MSAVFTRAEIAVCDGGRRSARRFAMRFAAKEAVLKALAFTDGRGSFWQDVEITQGDDGTAGVQLRGRLRALAADHGAGRVHLSFAGAGNHALAVAMIEARGDAASRPDTNHTGD